MKKSLVWAGSCALLVLSLMVAVAAQSAPARHDDEVAGRGGLAPALVGSWQAQPERTALATDFDVSVWGPGASAVRDVSLAIGSSGDATLTVTRKVVDARGRVKPASTSIEEAKLVIRGPQETTGPRVEHGVTVVSAQRRFPDDPKDTWPIDGLRVRVVSFADSDRSIEIRFDTPEGRGSFWQLLRRAPGAKR